MQWLVVGAGYTGSALAQRLRAAGHDVIATRRTATPETVALDLADVGAVEYADAIIVCCAPPGADPVREMYNLVSLSGRRIVYVSATGVYARGGERLFGGEPRAHVSRIHVDDRLDEVVDVD